MNMKYNYEKILTVGFKDIERQIYDAVCRAARQITKDLLEQLDKHLMNTRDKKRYANKQIRRATVKTVYGEVEYNRHKTKSGIWFLDLRKPDNSPMPLRG